MNDQKSGPALRIADVRVLTMRLTAAVGVDQVNEITYTDGRFLSSTHVVGGPPGPARELGRGELSSLLAELQAERHHKGPGIDTTVLAAFIHLVAQAVQSAPSGRFDHARFGDVAKDASGAIVGHLGLGVDLVGTVHDAKGAITFEQHPVPMKPGPFQTLSASDRASLAAVLGSYVASTKDANPLWSNLLTDLGKPPATT